MAEPIVRRVEAIIREISLGVGVPTPMSSPEGEVVHNYAPVLLKKRFKLAGVQSRASAEN